MIPNEERRARKINRYAGSGPDQSFLVFSNRVPGSWFNTSPLRSTSEFGLLFAFGREANRKQKVGAVLVLRDRSSIKSFQQRMPAITKITQNDFEKRTINALKLEPMRFELYEMGLELIRSKYEIEAYLLILATWNFARFRYVTRSFDLNKFRKIIKETAPFFAKLATEKLKTADLDAIAGDIKFIQNSSQLSSRLVRQRSCISNSRNFL